MLENEQGLCDPGLLGGALFRLAPLQGLDLNLPVDPGKAPTLLQHSLHHTASSLPLINGVNVNLLLGQSGTQCQGVSSGGVDSL